MTTFINNWFKQIFIHQAAAAASTSDKKINDRCLIVDKPSTISDVDAMPCDEIKLPTDIKSEKKDTIVIDKFQACFIDCTCQCEARKVIPQMNTNECKNIKTKLFEELFDQIRDPSYEIDCSCDCGKKGMRKLKFNYTTGNKTINGY